MLLLQADESGLLLDVSLFQITAEFSNLKIKRVLSNDGDVVVCSQIDERNEDWFHILNLKQYHLQI